VVSATVVKEILPGAVVKLVGANNNGNPTPVPTITVNNVFGGDEILCLG